MPGARLAVEHLAGLGHERITHVHGRRALGAAERRRGYTEAMRAAGLDSEAAQLLMDTPPTAVIAFNDHCAAGLMANVCSHGITVPGNLSVVGYDDSHIASLSSVSLTTVAQDAPNLARSALGLALVKTEGGPDKASVIVVPPQLVMRTTSAAPAGARHCQHPTEQNRRRTLV